MVGGETGDTPALTGFPPSGEASGTDVLLRHVRVIKRTGSHHWRKLMGLLAVFFVPSASVLIAGMWLTLLVRFGLLPLLLERSEMPTGRKKHLTRNVTRVILGIGVIGVPIVMPILCCNKQLLHRLGDLGIATIGEESSGVAYMFLYSPVWLALIVEGWLVLLFYFGSHNFLSNLGVPLDRRQRINRHVVIAMLLVGLLTGLIGSGWWAYMATADWNRLEEASRLGSVVLSPASVLLTLGMVVMLPISLEQALFIEESDGQREDVARNMTLVLLLAMTLLGVIGAIGAGPSW
jgi:hypothetical protein